MTESAPVTITPSLTCIELRPSIPGYEEFISGYVFRGEKTAIVDVGPRAAIPHLLRTLAGLNIGYDEIDYIILSHIHMDHAGGVGTAVKTLSRARVIAHPRAYRHLIDPTQLWKASLETLGDVALQYGEIEPVPEDRVMVAVDLMKLDLGGGLVLEILLTPGHAPHHLSVFDRANGVLIAGEAAGVCIDGVLRPTTPPPARIDDTLASIDRLIALAPVKLCYAHFGCYDNAVERLKEIRRKTLAWCEIVKPAARMGKGPEEILSIVREKDSSLLDYMDNLTPDQYERERLLLLNTIKGMLGPVS